MIKSNIEKINLSASARLIQQLGEQLISDELVALMELIKNGYDADATNIDIDIDTNIDTEYGRGKIVIEDNGNGMIPSIITSAFLRLSSNFKEEERLSLYFKRRVLGKKGIGRLSFQRLGRYIRVYTTPRVERYQSLLKEDDNRILEQYNSYIIDIDWFNFTMDKDLNDIGADLYYDYNSMPNYGTRIEILGIRNQSFWEMNQHKISRLKKEIFGMVNPFIKDTEEKFRVNITIDGKDYSSDEIDEEILEKSCDVKVDFSFNDWIFTIDIDRKTKYYVREKEKKIKKMEDSEFELYEQHSHTDIVNSFTIDFNDFEKMKKEFPYLGKVRFDLVENKKQDFIKAYPGDFTGTLYVSDFSADSKNYVRDLINAKVFSKNKIRLYDEISRVWDTAKGVYIFRNKFRILPYGIKDWIGFTDKSQTYKSNIYKENTVAGYITIDGITSENLEEQTNRQGLIEDEYGKNFLSLIQDVLLEILVREDTNFREGYTDDKHTLNSEIISTNNQLLKFKKILTEERKKDETFQNIQNTLEGSMDESNKQQNGNLGIDLNDNASKEEILFNILGQYFSDEGEIKKIIYNQDKSIRSMLEIILKTMNQGELLKKNINDLLVKFEELRKIDSQISTKTKQELYLKNSEIEEIKEILPLVGQGIIVESLTHELNRIDENIKTYAAKTIEGLIENISRDKLIDYQDIIIEETTYLSEQLSHLEPTYRKNYSVAEHINVKNLLEDLYIKNGPMVKKAKKNNIKIIIEGDSFILKANKGFLITIFDNIFLNSLYWINTIENSNKYLSFKVNHNGIIEVCDSGPGIHPYMESKIFTPFESMKESGRGLGLFIVQELMGFLGADIYLSNERRNDRLYKFVLKFNDYWGV